MNDFSEALILHVEDTVDDEVLVRRALKTGVPSNTVVNARDGREAFGYLFEGKALAGMAEHRLPDLILLDLKLPIMSGIEILEKLRSNEATKFIPVVVLTSSDEAKDVERCYRLGANSYVAKPVDFERFLEAVKSIGNYWLGTNRTSWAMMALLMALS